MNRSSKIVKLVYFYISIPFVIFLLGWCKPMIGIIGTGIVLFSLFKACKSAPEIWIPKMNKQIIIPIFFMIFLALLWVYLSGIGGAVYQNPDHVYRNTMYECLVTNKWPVIGYSSDLEQNVQFVYYTAFWLPASVFGKLFGIGAGYIFQILWATLGVVFLFYFLLAYVEKAVINPIFVFIFFSGMDFVGMLLWDGSILPTIFSYNQLEWWAGHFQFSSMTTQLFWVFNQAIFIWIICMLLYFQKDNHSIIFIIAFSVLSSTLPFIGCIPFVIYYILRRYKDLIKSFKTVFACFIRDLFTFQNIVGGGFVGILSYLYVRENLSGAKISTLLSEMSGNNTKSLLITYILFLLLEVGFYFIVIYKVQKKNPLFYISFGCLAIAPLICVGSAADFSMRASIPALVYLVLLVIDSLNRKEMEPIYRKLLIGILIIGALTPIHEINRTVQNTYYGNNEMGKVSETDLWNGENFTGIAEDSFFLKYIGK